MKYRISPRTFAVFNVALMLILIGAAYVVSRPSSQKDSDRSDLSNVQVVAQVIPSQVIPSPVGTYDRSKLTPLPQITIPPLPPLPPPPATIALTPATITTPGTIIPATTTPVIAVTATSVAIGGPDHVASDLNVAWGAETDSDLTIWGGVYSDYPTPYISNAEALVKWDAPLSLLDLAFSPNQQYLAILTRETWEGEGDRPTWLSVVDINTGSLQNVPDYIYSDLYERKFYRAGHRILGWLDDTTFAIQQGNEYAVVTANRNGATYSRVAFPPEDAWALESALSPDRQKFFSDISAAGSTAGGFWEFNVDGAKARHLVGRADAKELVYPKWSPDGLRIGFMSPKQVVVDSNNFYSFSKLNVWTLNLSDNTQQQLTADDAWDVSITWSPSASHIGFLRADSSIPNDGSVSWIRPEMVTTNIFAVDAGKATTKQISSFTNVKNSALTWTDGGNFLLSSTYGSTANKPGILSVAGNGAVAVLISGSVNEALVRPVVAGGSVMPGMPRAGEGITKP